MGSLNLRNGKILRPTRLAMKLNPVLMLLPPILLRSIFGMTPPTYMWELSAGADMEKLRSSLRNRDEGYPDDHVIVGLDPYRDGRYVISQNPMQLEVPWT